MNGRVLLSSLILVAGLILLLFGIGHNALSSGMSFAEDNKTVLLILGIIFTTVGLTGFVYFLFTSLKRSSEKSETASLDHKDHKGTSNLTTHEMKAAPYGDTP